MKRLYLSILVVLLLLLPINSIAQVFDVIFVMDGSGSISSTDFRLQKDGIIAALNNSVIVPRDGSIAIALVQFANYSTRTEIPHTVVDSDQDITTIVNQVDAIVQIGGLTNPGDGIASASSLLNAIGQPGLNQSICLSTDGLRNAGQDVATALNNARTSSVDLDQFGVIAIEDPPFFYAQDFHNFYDPLVFGGGAVAVVRNAAEFANTVGAVCFPSELELIGLEVVQTIQDWTNSVQPIEDKTTYVRAHIQTKDTNPVLAVARLRGFRNGVELSGSPLTAINLGGAITAQPDAAGRRNNWNDSLNFQLPQSWLNGTVELHLEAVGGNLEFSEPAEEGGSANDGIVEITFEPTEDLEVRLVAINWTDSSGTAHNPTTAHLNELTQRLLAIYPVDNVDVTTTSFNWTGTATPNLTYVNQQLETMRANDGCTDANCCEQLYYGALVGRVNASGLANGIPGTVASGDPGSTGGVEPNVHAHELGHCLDRHHSANQALLGTSTSPSGVVYKNGPCGSVASLTAPEFPYIFQVGGVNRATMGPMDLGDDRLIYGLDTRVMNVLDPNQDFDLMSYCSPLWISDITYKALQDNINNRYPSDPAGCGGGGGGGVADFQYILVRVSVDFVADTIEFLPFTPLIWKIPVICDTCFCSLFSTVS